MQNKPLKVVPRLNGKQIDIFTMYRRVAKLGGSAKVSAEKRWGDIADGEPLHPPRCTRYTHPALRLSGPRLARPTARANPAWEKGSVVNSNR